ncbi:MAG: IMP dehydrogenase, partial [Bacilli bacterium]|nr:IMP dehydrogenase [Bacilli bacterium]
LPRNINIAVRLNYAQHGKWAAFSLSEFKKYFCDIYNVNYTDITWNVLIDVANGHMKQIYELVKLAKLINGKKICIMIGNIANPDTYMECYLADIQYIRIGIGGGSGCLSSSNLGCHYPMASLVNDTYKVKKQIYNNNNFLNKSWDEMPQIVADGNIRNYDDSIKALSLGADYVMIGSVFASLIESAGETFSKHMDGSKYFYTFDEIVDYTEFYKTHPNLYKEFYGMASKEGQIAINGCKTKTSEGIRKELPVTGTIPQWSENMNAYLRSAMSYCNVRNINDFNPENVIVNVVSNNTVGRINK